METPLMNNQEDSIKSRIWLLLSTCLMVAFVVVIIGVAAVAFQSIAVLNALMPEPASKAEIRNIVIENRSLFEDAVANIKKLDKNISSVEMRNKSVFTGGIVNGQYVETQIENETFKKIFSKTGIENIYIYSNSIVFASRGRGRNYDCGIIRTESGSPIGYQGEKMKLTPKGAGLEYNEEGGNNRYYTEKIIGNWYFYEMSF